MHYQRWSRQFGATATSYMFPGFAAMALVIAAFSDPKTRRDPRIRMCAAAAIGSVVVSFAPSWPVFPVLHAIIPLFHGVRALHRIGQVTLLMVAVLAGSGVAVLGGRWPGGRVWFVAAAAILITVNGEALRAPMGFVWFDGVPKIYDVIAADPRAVVVEMPFPMPQQWFLMRPTWSIQPRIGARC